ncbi:4'-phosphopantetheinyl transferase family protein [Streptomyces griseocarneus]|uniref:4'-phosphopantetheinyl transferase family protein n=1 Tax=Streptomyces griseocarneus TaxID=51201 RepID=UPI001CCF0021|nr:4'-phosphopantetheinyl transferase superfamily protein [Streptomyces griseocarneus]MBZ6477608.1 4'-phosphopantetheinyl transferase superfamily protein [Streptomyces griseocarneus]
MTAGAPVAGRAARALRDGELHLWALPGPWPGVPPPAAAELGAAERERAAAFVRPEDRLRYVAAHVALRRVLAAYLGLPPGEVGLRRAPCVRCRGPHGRPVVAPPDGGTHFSLSHTRDLVLIAVAASPVGVDAEAAPSAETADLCRDALHPAEREELAALPDAERAEAFGRLWTRKEAYLKGLGAGLARPPAADYLGERTDAAAPARPAGWTVRNVPARPGTVAAAALGTAGRAPGELPLVAHELPARCLDADGAAAVGLIERMSDEGGTREEGDHAGRTE